MKTSQNAWVLSRIQKNGRVTRNEALSNHITRLASRICDLREAGHSIVAKRAGRDYEYTMELCTK